MLQQYIYVPFHANLDLVLQCIISVIFPTTKIFLVPKPCKIDIVFYYFDTFFIFSRFSLVEPIKSRRFERKLTSRQKKNTTYDEHVVRHTRWYVQTITSPSSSYSVQFNHMRILDLVTKWVGVQCISVLVILNLD